MTPIDFLCPRCGQDYEAPSNRAGEQFVCDTCQHVFIIKPIPTTTENFPVPESDLRWNIPAVVGMLLRLGSALALFGIIIFIALAWHSLDVDSAPFGLVAMAWLLIACTAMILSFLAFILAALKSR